MKSWFIEWDKSKYGGIGGCETHAAMFENVFNIPVKTCEYMAGALYGVKDYNKAKGRLRTVDKAAIVADYLETVELIGEAPNFYIADDVILGLTDIDTSIITIVQNPWKWMADFFYRKDYFNKGNYFEMAKNFVKLQKDQVRRSKKVVAVSAYMAKYCEEVLDRKPDEIINIGVDMLQFPKREVVNEKKVGIFVGSFSPIAGWHIMAKLIKEFKDVNWICVFKDVVPSKTRLLNVKTYSKLPYHKMASLYGAADFFVLPAPIQSYGMAALEAMSCNLPVITSNTGLFWDWGCDGEFGFAVSQWNYEAYRDAVADMVKGDCLKNKRGINYVGENGTAYEERFSPRKLITESGLDVYSWQDKWVKLLNTLE